MEVTPGAILGISMIEEYTYNRRAPPFCCEMPLLPTLFYLAMRGLCGPLFLQSDEVVVDEMRVARQIKRTTEEVARQIYFQKANALGGEGHVPPHQRHVRQKLEMSVCYEVQFGRDVWYHCARY